VQAITTSPALIPFYLYNCAPGRVPGQGVQGGETPLALLT
jgi:hypothetical protein